MRLVLAFVTASALTGCSWIYNPSNIGNSNIDAPSDAEIILDADPSMLVVNGINPRTIYEGQGDGGSQAALVVLDGHNMIDANTKVELVAMSSVPSGAKLPEVGTPVISKNGNWIAVPIIAHVDPMLDRTQQITFDVQVSEDIPMQPGMRSMAHSTLVLQGLAELAPTGATYDTTMLLANESYSSVTLPASLAFTGSKRAIIHATASITAQAVSAAAGAAGGCAGGAAAAPGDCAGGGAGTAASAVSAGGGGGAGCASDGAKGGGAGGGAAGPRTGDELMVSYDGTASHSANRSPGGGGGGTFIGLFTGGPGGGGGGTIELTAGGDVSVGAITVNGGGGSDGKGGGPGGGGGAGGLVMLRAGRTLTTTGAISISGGAGSGTGGNGAGGRIRWDALMGSAPTMASVATGLPGTLHRGPSFVIDGPIFRDPKVKILIQGTKDDKFQIYTTNYSPSGPHPDTGDTMTLGPDGTVSYTQVLQQGLTQLCLTLDGGVQGTSEADKCVYVAFLP